MGPDPALIWLVRAGETTGTRGRLAIDQDVLTFTPDEGEPLRLPARRIRGARRELGTPVLTLTYLDDEEGEAHLLLFFARPPPLPEGGRRSVFRSHGLERTAGTIGLTRSNRELKPVIKEWERLIESLRRRR